MTEKLIATIETIKLTKVEQFDETAIKQTVILRLLAELDWNIFDRDEVYPEYTIESKRVDFSLRSNNKNKVFIEVKRPGEENLEKHQEQLLNYSFRQGVQLAILTNGITWWFYLPLREGEWTKRKFYTIDFKSQNEKEIAEKLTAFLLKENILTDKSIQTAEETLKGNNKEKEIKESLPVVWKNLLNKPSKEFIQLLADETEKHCGYRPIDDYVVKFLNNNEEIKETEQVFNDDAFTKTFPYENNKRAEQTKLKVTFPNGIVINEYTAIDTFIKTVQEFGIFKVKQLPIGGAPIISDKAFNVNVKTKYKQIPNTQYYIINNNNTVAKKELIDKIAKILDIKVKVEIVER